MMQKTQPMKGIAKAFATIRAARRVRHSDGPLRRGAFRSAVPLMITAVALYAFDAQRSCAADGDFVWGRSMGNDGVEEGRSAKTDSDGNVYITGFFEGTVDFDPGPGTANLSSEEYARSAFILKLDPAGDFAWVKQLVGGASEAFS
ncbi:MAG: hypothetical protein IT364_25925, partial [Candidatus Hydrogenedentes bacterium]|nr:hypothetical protein [Candidatus Hydrogenedentota bacterium]